ncbi:MAG: class II fructose-bisphosphate aldolase [Candidatus Omnitrophica bacterium]|nr:class II fructose-bisphosphate aldolase [Candidatus Omnitrophota bacterium]
MPIVPMREMLADALKENYAVGYFESWDQCSLEAVLEAAEDSRSPVILGFGGASVNMEWFDKRGLYLLASLGRTATEDSKVPVSLMLNEVPFMEQIRRGIALGFNAVMLDTSHLPIEKNIRFTKQAVNIAHSAGADAEGECGRLPDASGSGINHAGSATDPEEAARYAEETGIDALAVSAGNVHIDMNGKNRIDTALLSKIREKVHIPLVLHGGTSIAEEDIPEVIRLGVAKFNVGTVLKEIFLTTIIELGPSADDGKVQQIVGSRKRCDMFETAKNRIKAEVMRRMILYGSTGKA